MYNCLLKSININTHILLHLLVPYDKNEADILGTKPLPLWQLCLKAYHFTGDLFHVSSNKLEHFELSPEITCEDDWVLKASHLLQFDGPASNWSGTWVSSQQTSFVQS